MHFTVQISLLTALLIAATAPPVTCKCSLDVGFDHVAVVSDGVLYAAGGNSYGQLARPANALAWNELHGVSSVGSRLYTHVCTGFYFTCVLSEDGGVYCAGRSGRRGDGLSTLGDSRHQLAKASGLGEQVTAISCGSDHWCALKDGVAFCVGRYALWRVVPISHCSLSNAQGALGLEGNVDRWTAEAVQLKVKVRSIATGPTATCLVSSTHAIYCTGVIENAIGDVILSSSIFVTVREDVAVDTTVIVGGSHLCAHLSYTSLLCMGDNSAGQLATGNRKFSRGFSHSFVGQEIAAVAVSGKATCALLVDGSVRCAGEPNLLGLSASPSNDSAVVLGASAQLVAGGFKTFCAVVGGGITCWGQLGGSNSGSSKPLRQLRVDGTHLCATTPDATHVPTTSPTGAPIEESTRAPTESPAETMPKAAATTPRPSRRPTAKPTPLLGDVIQPIFLTPMPSVPPVAVAEPITIVAGLTLPMLIGGAAGICCVLLLCLLVCAMCFMSSRRKHKKSTNRRRLSLHSGSRWQRSGASRRNSTKMRHSSRHSHGGPTSVRSSPRGEPAAAETYGDISELMRSPPKLNATYSAVKLSAPPPSSTYSNIDPVAPLTQKTSEYNLLGLKTDEEAAGGDYVDIVDRARQKEGAGYALGELGKFDESVRMEIDEEQ